MHSLNDVSPPRTVAEVEQLVQRLYKPNTAAVSTRISDELQQLQRSPYGWQLADQLLGSEDSNVQFFAALTFTVKLNNDGPSLDAETAQTVQLRLISWLVRLIRQGQGGLVGKKLCSTLTTYFLRSPVAWENPLLHLALSFSNGDAISQSDSNEIQMAFTHVLDTLDIMQQKALLWFAASLAEEIGRIDANAPAHARFHNQMQHVVNDASALMGRLLDATTNSTDTSARGEALRCYLTWINYAQPIWPRNPEPLQALRDLIEPAAQCLLDDTLDLEALDIFRDILESYTTFFQPQHMDMLANIIYTHVRPSIYRHLYDATSDDQIYAQFAIAFGCANIQQVVEQPENETGSQAIIQIHLDIISASGYPGDDDQLSIQSIEFWNTYIEYINDIVGSQDLDDGEDQSWLPQAKSVMQQVVELLWRKMVTPLNEVAKDWTDDEHESFKEFRLDASDLMLSTFVLLGRDMLELLVRLALQSLEAGDWRAVEAALYCLDGLADNVVEEMAYEEIVGQVFKSSLFRDIADFNQNIPMKTRRTAIDLLGSYGEYIERHAEFLPDAVRFLFASLEAAGLANQAAKSIASLCSACRASLTGELDGFLAQYQRFLESNTSEPYTKEKVIGAIAAIIQAQSPERAKARPLLILLENIEKDIAATRDFAAAGDEEMVELVGVSALECLASIGKGMQVPEEVPIDLYEDDPSAEARTPDFWSSEEGQAVQQRIVSYFSVLQIVGKYSAAIDAACQVLRSGFTETAPGPFVLPTSVTVGFVQQCSLSTPQLEFVLSTACMMITQHSRRDSKRIDSDVSALYKCVAEFARTLVTSSNDPGVAAACIEVLTRMMPQYVHILLGELAPYTLDFTLTGLQGAEALPRRSACEFWTKLLKPQTAATSQEVQQQLEQVMDMYGPKLANALVFQIGGAAHRSDVELLCDPLKALLLHHGGAQAWLQQSLTSERFPAQSVGVDDRTRFLRQLSSSRSDGRKVKDLTKAFWAACRGTVVSYS